MIFGPRTTLRPGTAWALAGLLAGCTSTGPPPLQKDASAPNADARSPPMDGSVAALAAVTPPRGDLSLANDAQSPGTSANLPLTILFASPARRVGMYAGNGSGTVTATLTAYDANGAAIFSTSRANLGTPVMTFLGIDGGSARIASVRLDYGNKLNSAGTGRFPPDLP